MNCPRCARPMRALFISQVCDFCDGLEGDEADWAVGFVVWRGRPTPSDEYVFPTREDAERWRVHVVAGPPVDVIPATIARLHADTLVIGSVARSGISGAVMGNTAERLTDTVSCSVIVVKPPDFG